MFFYIFSISVKEIHNKTTTKYWIYLKKLYINLY